MKLDSRQQRLLWFMGALAFCALIINGHFFAGITGELPTPTKPASQPLSVSATQDQPREIENAAAARATAENARYVARYLNPSLHQTAAIVVASENRTLNNSLATALAEHFRSSGSVSTSLFTPEFISDGLFDTALGGSSQVVNQLELAKVLNTLLLAKQTVEYSKNPELANTITANMKLDITILSATARGQNQSWSFIATGAGFSEMQARQMAEERIVKQIEKDTRMSLNL